MTIIDGIRSFREKVSTRAHAQKQADKARYQRYVEDHAVRQQRRSVADRFRRQTGYTIWWNPRPGSMAPLAHLSFEEMNQLVRQRHKRQERQPEEK